MNYKNHLMIAALSLSTLVAASQETPGIIREDWSKNPVLHKVASGYAKESAVIISDHRRIEYADLNDDQVEYKTFHKIILVNDDRGIEAFNKIYLPAGQNSDIVDIKARTILPGGKIIELNKNDIKEIKEEGSTYKIFALEGLVKGSEIEYLYTYNANLNYFGREILQGNYHVLESQVEIVSPERLVFETKSFNGATTPLSDTSITGKSIVRIAQNNIPGAEEEKYSMYTSNLKRIEYKLSYNKAKNESERIFTWNALAKRIQSMYSAFTEKELKKISNIVAENGWSKIRDDKEKIIAVENYFKKNIATRDDVYSDDAENIEWILKNKICSYRGMVRLFAAAYTTLSVEHEHVVCGSREDFALDKAFENWLNCDNSLIYFPAHKKYMAPTKPETRYPWIEPIWGASPGIFCKPTMIGNFKTAIAYVKQIELEGPDQNQSNIEARVQLNPSLDTLMISSKQVQTGYLSNAYRRIFNYNSEEDLKNIVREMIRHNLGTEKILSWKVVNKEFENITDNKPFIFESEVQASGMVEKAGNKILVKIGELIGPQVEMYQEKKRMFPIEIAYGHTMARKLTMEIPSGYRIKNPDDLKMNSVYKENDEITIGFESAIELNGNTLTVNIMEQYRKTFYSIDQYDPFQKIINMAADFNKVILVLEKI